MKDWQAELIRTAIMRGEVRLADVGHVHREYFVPLTEALDWVMEQRPLRLVMDLGIHKVGDKSEIPALLEKQREQVKDAKRVVYAAAGVDPNLTTTVKVHWEYVPPGRWEAALLRAALKAKPFFKWVGAYACPLSLLASLIVYASWWNLSVALGVLTLLGIHELGHKWAGHRVGIESGEPIFWPGVGALINIKKMPDSAWDEAVLGIGGPLVGTGAAIGFLLIPNLGAWTGDEEYWYTLGMMGVVINLFNLLPVRPLDGGRIIGILTHWVTLPGLLLLTYMVVRPLFDDWNTPAPIWVVLWLVALLEFFHARKKAKTTTFLTKTPWKKRLGMAFVWVALVALLVTLMVIGWPGVPTNLTLSEVTP